MNTQNETYHVCFHRTITRCAEKKQVTTLYVNGKKILRAYNFRTVDGYLLGFWVSINFNDRLKPLLRKKISPFIVRRFGLPYVVGGKGKKYVLEILNVLGYKMKRVEFPDYPKKVHYRIDNVNNINL